MSRMRKYLLRLKHIQHYQKSTTNWFAPQAFLMMEIGFAFTRYHLESWTTTIDTKNINGWKHH